MNKELWIQVEDALDERVDPFEVPAIAAALNDDVEATRAVRLMLDRIEALGSARTSQQTVKTVRPRPTSQYVLAAAALVFVSLTFKLVWFSPSETSSPLTPLRNIDTLTLVVEHSTPPPARLSRIVLDSTTTTTITLEGESQ